jgi:hypothetical protein
MADPTEGKMDEHDQLTRLGYEYRSDGNFLILKTCRHCEEPFSVHAMSNALSKQDIYGLCYACEALREFENDSRGL